VLLAYLWIVPTALLIPLLAVLFGAITALLDTKGLSAPAVTLGSQLEFPVSQSLAEQTPLRQLSLLVAICGGIAVTFSISIWILRIVADARARRIVKSLHVQILRQSLLRAELEGAAAQHAHAKELIGTHLPALQEGLSLWYRVIPHRIVILCGSLFVALLVNVWLTLLAVVSGALLWRLFYVLRYDDQWTYSHWEVPRARSRMAEIVSQAPLLARLQSQGLADQAFAAELESLYQQMDRRDQRRGRVWPLLFCAIAAAIAVMVLGFGVNLFDPDQDQGLSVPAGLVMSLALVAAVAASGRLLVLSRQLQSSGDAEAIIFDYLKQSSNVAPSEHRVGLAGVREGVEIRDVSLGTPGGTPILRNLSLRLNRGTMVALLGTESVATRALVELLMGFGQPSEGQVLIDGIKLRDVHPQALSQNVMWIEPDGPIWDGTIQENLRGSKPAINSIEIVHALQEVGVYDRLNRLPEGLNTIITAGDSMLGVEATYAMATARAILHRPPILLAMEPPPPAEHVADDPCLKALRKLADQGTLVVVLPRRLSTLRTVDRVVLLNGPRLAGEGKHAELLSSSDLYRHLNYLLFNPYRQQKSDL
jgi:ABC-type multidrug transport system fused ATPase/permease subunit